MIKKFICIYILVMCFVFSHDAHASTNVGAQITSNTVWSKEFSPYILSDDISIDPGVTLTMLPGTKVLLAGHILDIYGGLSIQGSSHEQVEIGAQDDSGIISINSGDTTVVASQVIFRNVTSLSATDRSVEYDHASFDHTGIRQNRGSVSIKNASFNQGLFGVYLVDSVASLDTVSVDGYTKAGIYIRRGSLSITGSDIEHNTIGIQVQDRNPVLLGKLFDFLVLHAYADSLQSIHQSTISGNTINIKSESATTFDARNVWWGTVSGPQGSVVGDVLTDPWLTQPPQKHTCCSNVLFIPGIEASRLYTPGLGFENQLWEPEHNSDVTKLFLNTDGTSKDPHVYTRDIIEETNVFQVFRNPIYKSFADSMRSLVESGSMQAWKPFPYDWRLDVDTIIASSTLLSDIKNLASSSDTGKVSIVAHSNGGLVAKRLIQKLQALGRADIVDKLILVAVPNFGTPQAIGALLYGDGQDLANGFILSKNTARGLAQNMPGAYNLIPSPQYIVAPTSPSILIDLLSVASINPTLYDRATIFHGSVDTWVAPDGIEVHSIVGTGLPTVDGILYKNNGDHEPVFTTTGDGTVVESSAIGNGQGKVHTFNLSELNGSSYNYGHGDIFEVGLVDLCVSNIILGVSCDMQYSHDPRDMFKLNIVSVHSPADIHLTDTLGRHTGIISTSSDDVRIIEQKIPNTQYLEFGEGKYIVSSDIASSTISLQGTGMGTFTLDIQSVIGSTSTTTEFVDIPVTPLTKAQVYLGTQTPLLLIDTNNDGVFDASTTPEHSRDPILLIKSLRGMLGEITLTQKVKDKLSNRLDTIERKILKNKVIRAIPGLKNLITRIDTGHKPFKSIDAVTRDAIVDLLGRLLDALDQNT